MKGSLDVHQVRLQALELRAQRADRAELHRTVLRIARHAARGHSQDAGLGIGSGARVLRRDQDRFMAGGVQAAAEGLDGSGNAVDPRKIDVRDHQDAHASSGGQ